jgi:hypothetical protein
MQLARHLALISCCLVLGCGTAAAQSLSPMHKTGATPSDVKGFKLLVGNPYPTRMTFVVVAMDPKFNEIAPRAVVRPGEIKLAPGQARGVTVQFAIGPEAKERTIGVCVLPKDLDGPLLPRVCGTYTGIMLHPGAGG